jgi:hypothetical protein
VATRGEYSPMGWRIEAHLQTLGIVIQLYLYEFCDLIQLSCFFLFTKCTDVCSVRPLGQVNLARRTRAHKYSCVYEVRCVKLQCNSHCLMHGCYARNPCASVWMRIGACLDCASKRRRCSCQALNTCANKATAQHPCKVAPRGVRTPHAATPSMLQRVSQ